jgi:HSP20 family molecular chaperone IbpA
MVFDIFGNDPFFKSFFFNTPTESKPPSALIPKYAENSTHLIGTDILYALAGFRKEDIKVWSKKNKLFINGDSNKEGSSVYGSKFACEFKHEFNVSDKLDLTKLTVDFENGLLKIFIPTKAEVDTDKILHFGN